MIGRHKADIFWRIARKYSLHDQKGDIDALRPNGRWGQLPVELVVKIFNELSVEEIVRLSAVCRTFRTIIGASKALLYRTECHLENVVDGNKQLYSLEERCGRLRRWRAAWKTAGKQWATKTATYLEALGDIVFSSDGRVLVQLSGETQDILVTRLPSESRGVQAETWKLPRCQFAEDIFCHDSAEGLLIIAQEIDLETADMHILSERTGLPHPAALQPIITVKSSDFVDLENAEGWIFGTHFAIVLREEGGHSFFGNNLRIYNWKTGDLIKSIVGKLIWSIAALDTQHLLVPVYLPMCEQPCLAIVDSLRGSEDTPLMSEVMSESVLAMQLPPVYFPMTYRKVTIWGGPGGITQCHDVPFSPSHSSLVLVLHLEIGLPEGNPEGFEESIFPTQKRTFIIPVSAFLSRMEMIKSDQNQFCHHRDETRAYPRPMTILPWVLWGHDACLLPDTTQVRGLCGSRVLVSENVMEEDEDDSHYEVEPETEETVCIYDFATIPSLLKDLAERHKSTEGQGMFSIPLPYHQPVHDVLETRVLSAAPFRRIVTDVRPTEDEELVLYEDGVCIFPANTQDPIKVYSL